VKIDPFAWFSDVLSRIADHPIKRLEELLPHRWAREEPRKQLLRVRPQGPAMRPAALPRMLRKSLFD
jgi:hypothetical protein